MLKTYQSCDCCKGLITSPDRDYFGSSKSFVIDHPKYKVVCHVCVKFFSK